jgi:hypothetical protein
VQATKTCVESRKMQIQGTQNLSFNENIKIQHIQASTIQEEINGRKNAKT